MLRKIAGNYSNLSVSMETGESSCGSNAVRRPLCHSATVNLQHTVLSFKSQFSQKISPDTLRPLFFYFLVYGFIGRKNGSVGRGEKKNLKNNDIGRIMSSCRKKVTLK